MPSIIVCITVNVEKKGGEESFQLKFYRDCGFKEYKVIKNFFVDNYPEPIIEDDGNQCVDMVYLKYTT